MYELEVNEDNIKKLLNDTWDRNKSIYNFWKLIYTTERKATICIDGDLGTGKIEFFNIIRSYKNI